MRAARVISLSAALLLSPPSVIGVAAAELAAASARLEVHALPDCTTREELAARVAARSRHIHFDDAAAGPTLRAIIATTPRGGAVAELQIEGPNGRTSTRRISAPSCAEATDALALIIALTLDPTASAAGPDTTAVPAAGPPALPPEAAAPAGQTPRRAGEAPAHPTRAAAPPESSPPAVPAPAVAPPSEQASAVIAVAPPRPVASRPRLGGGLAGELVIGPAPEALPGLSVYLVAALDREALWSPAAIIRATHAWTSGLLESGGTAAFTLDALTLDACLLRLSASVFAARACASALYGRLAATGSETFSPATANRPYAAVGGALVLSARVGHRLEISGRIGGGASLVRDSFTFSSPNAFYRTAAATLAAGLGIGALFP